MMTGPSRGEAVRGDLTVPSLEDHRVWRRPKQACGRLSSPPESPSSYVEIKLVAGVLFVPLLLRSDWFTDCNN